MNACIQVSLWHRQEPALQLWLRQIHSIVCWVQEVWQFVILCMENCFLGCERMDETVAGTVFLFAGSFIRLGLSRQHRMQHLTTWFSQGRCILMLLVGSNLHGCCLHGIMCSEAALLPAF